MAVAAVVVAIDQAAKWLALDRLAGGREIDLLWTLRLRLVFNRGSAFGLGSRFAPIIALVVVAVVVGLLRGRHQLVGVLPVVAAGLVVGGAIGNLLDRVLRDGHGFLGGAVVDFIDVQWWPVFNVADSAICVGAVILAVTTSRERVEATAS